MERNKIHLLTIILFFAQFLSAPAVLSAQDPGYFIDYSGLRPRIIQKLAWDIEENAMRYDVEIQAYSERNELFEYNKTSTKNNFIDVYLIPGKYRYNVTAVDYLGRPCEASDWIDFEIISALYPVVEKYSPDAFYLDQNKKRELIVSGNNLSEETTIYLRNRLYDLFPVSMNFINDGMFKLSFDDEALDTGFYEVYAVNPGGLESVIGGFNIGYRKFIDVFLKAAFTPAYPVYGKMRDDFYDSIYIIGFSAAVELISSWRTMFNGGLEISYSLLMLNSYAAGNSGSGDSLLSLLSNNGIVFNEIDVNVSLQKRFNKRRMAVTLRFGCGLSLADISVQDEQSGLHNITDYIDNDFSLHINLGLSYMFLIYDIFYLDFGADFEHYVIGSSSGIIKPRMALVWKF